MYAIRSYYDAFTSLAGYVAGMGKELDALPEEGETARLKQELKAQAGQVGAMVGQSIIAFQFYDKLVQRLAHVSYNFV